VRLPPTHNGGNMDTAKRGIKLARMVRKWSKMPPDGDRNWESDFQYMAEVVVPFAEELLAQSERTPCGQPARHRGACKARRRA